MKNTLALSAAAVALLITSLSAQAAFVMDFTQVADPSQPLGFDVVATGSGGLDLTDLSLSGGTAALSAEIIPLAGVALTGPTTVTGLRDWIGISGPMIFGSGLRTFASSGSGDLVGISARFCHCIFLPFGYVSGHALSDTSTYDNATFASLGMTPGTHEWTWGTGAHADSFTLNAVIPEPSTWALMALGFAGLGFAGWRSRRRSVAIAA
jgi:hypothetical protein